MSIGAISAVADQLRCLRCFLLDAKVRADGYGLATHDKPMDCVAAMRAKLDAARMQPGPDGRDAMRWRAIRRHLTTAIGSMSPDESGPFRHFLQFLHAGRKFIPGSGNVDVLTITDAMLDAAADAINGDENAYLNAVAAATEAK